MRVITPRGNLLKVDRVVRVVEKSVNFNGSTRQFFEVAKNIDVESTGIAMRVAEAGMSTVFGPYEIYVGNLKPSVVEEIITTLTKEGYFDFTKFMYQNVESQSEVVLDGGDSIPFCSEFTNTGIVRRGITSNSELFERPLFGSNAPNMFGNTYCSVSDYEEFCDLDEEGEDTEEI